MSRPPTKIAVLAAVMGLVLAAVVPVAAASAAAGNDELDGAGNQALSIGVQQGAGSATVAISSNGSAVENATVTVTANSSYNGTGTYTTDPAGTVSLPLPGPNKTVTIDIAAEKDGLTGTATVTLRGNAGQGPAFVPPGQRVAAFVHALRTSDGVVRIGLFVSSYVHAIVPSGHAMTNAGPPAWLGTTANHGPPDFVKEDDVDERGPPDFVKRGNDREDRGPPDFVKKVGHGEDHPATSDDEEDASEEEDEDDEGG